MATSASTAATSWPQGPAVTTSLEHDSLPHTPSGRSTDTFLQAKDQAPISAFVQRTMSVTKEQWDRIMDEPRGHSRVHHNYAYGSNAAGSYAFDRQQTESKAWQSLGRQRGWKYPSLCWLPVISPYNRIYHIWSSLVLLVDLSYTAFLVPIGVGFSVSDTSLTWAAICDFAAGAVFAIDLFLGFQVGFVVTYNLRKKTIMDGRLITRYYLRRGTFLVDTISTVAWLAQIIVLVLVSQGRGHGRVSNILQVLRLLRLTRLTRLMKRMFINSIGTNQISHLPFVKRLSSGTTYLVQILYGVMVLINALGCLWYWTAAQQGFDGTWVAVYGPLVREFGDGGLVTQQMVQDFIPQTRLYLISIYWAMTTISTVGYGDITPQTSPEIAVTLVVFFVGIMFFGILLGSIGEMLQRASKDARRAQIFREKMEAVEAWTTKRKIPRRMRHKIRAYYAEVWVRQAEEGNEAQVFSELPHTLRNEVVWHMCRKLFTDLYLFSDLDPPTQLLLASKMQPVRVGAGHDVCNQGDVADRIWVLQEGQLMALYHDQEAEIEAEPAILGEAALLQEQHEAFQMRLCGYRTLTSCTLWEICMRDLLPVLHRRPDLQAHFVARVKDRLLSKMHTNPDVWLPEFVTILQGISVSDDASSSPGAATHSSPWARLAPFAALSQQQGGSNLSIKTSESPTAAAAGSPAKPTLEPLPSMPRDMPALRQTALETLAEGEELQAQEAAQALAAAEEMAALDRERRAAAASQGHVDGDGRLGARSSAAAGDVRLHIDESDGVAGGSTNRELGETEPCLRDGSQGPEGSDADAEQQPRETAPLKAARSWLSRHLSRSNSSRSVSFNPESEVLGADGAPPKQPGHSRRGSEGPGHSRRSSGLSTINLTAFAASAFTSAARSRSLSHDPVGSGGLERMRSGMSTPSSLGSALGPGSGGRRTRDGAFTDSDSEDDAESKLISRLSAAGYAAHAAPMAQLAEPATASLPDPAAGQMMSELLAAMRTLQGQMQDLMHSQAASQPPPER